MRDIHCIEYTIEVKKRTFKVSLPKFIDDWDAVVKHALEEAYRQHLWEVDDLEVTETTEFTEYPKIDD